METNIVSWFEIPVQDMQRAKTFYTSVFGNEFTDAAMPGMEMAMFPWKQGAPYAAGCLLKSEGRKPAAEGISVYLQCNDLSEELSKVKQHGGKIITPKYSLGEYGGFAAHIMDSEGNRIGLSSQV